MKIQKKLLKEIDTTLRNFNAKIRRLEKSGKEDIIIPVRVYKSEFKDYESTKDIRRRLNQLKRFSKKGAEQAIKLSDNSTISIWEKKEHDILKRSALSKISKRVKYYETHVPRVYGKKQDVTFAKTADEAYLRLIAERNRLKTKGLMSRRQMEIENLRSARILNENRHQFRQNYYKMLDDIGGMLGQRDKAELIKDKLDELNDKEFVDFFNEDKGLNAVTFFYQTIEDGLFYQNYDYIKTNFDLMADHLSEFDTSELRELRMDRTLLIKDYAQIENLEKSKTYTKSLKAQNKQVIKDMFNNIKL